MTRFMPILVLFMFCRCERDFSIYPLRIPVVNCLFSNDSTIKVLLCESTGIFEDVPNIRFINNAQIELWENNVFKEIMGQHYQETFLNRFGVTKIYNFRSSIVPDINQQYKIIIQIPEYGTLNAKTSMPAKVSITNIDTTRYTINKQVESYESNERLLCNITFTDPPGKNYYMFLIKKPMVVEDKPVFDSDGHPLVINGEHININTKYELSAIPFECIDPVVDDWVGTSSKYESIFFEDNSFSNKLYTLKIILDGKNIGPYPNTYYPHPYSSKNELNQKIVFYLYNISTEYYNFYKTLFQAQKTHDDPFSEPKNIYTNINHGTGIFAGSTYTCDSIIIFNNKLKFFD